MDVPHVFLLSLVASAGSYLTCCQAFTPQLHHWPKRTNALHLLTLSMARETMLLERTTTTPSSFLPLDIDIDIDIDAVDDEESTNAATTANTNESKAPPSLPKRIKAFSSRQPNDPTTPTTSHEGSATRRLYARSGAVPDSMKLFAAEIHREGRISRSEEIELGTKTQEAMRLSNIHEQLKKKLKRDPTDEEWCAASGKINVQALTQAIDDGLSAKNKLVTSNLRMVQSVVNTYLRNGLAAHYNAGDMMQEGVLALIRAAEMFQPDRGFKFSTVTHHRAAAKALHGRQEDPKATKQSFHVPGPHADHTRIGHGGRPHGKVRGPVPHRD
jgi:hypothetical protein